MKSAILVLSATAALLAPSSGELLFSDTFNTADSASFDASSTAGRLTGSLSTTVVLRSWGAQEQINNNQLLIPAAGNSGVRFEYAAGPFGGANRFDWAAGATGAAILASGGFVVRFDWTPAGNTTPNWISFQVGTVNADSGNLTDDDYGILFRQNGNTERFDNTVNLGAGAAFNSPAAGVLRHAEITYRFTSFADGSMVTATSLVDGVQVASDSFTWDNNAGAMRMELGSNDAGNRVDNLRVSTIETMGFVMNLDGGSFLSSAPTGKAVGTLSAKFNDVSETALYTLVSGAGDTDNAKFQIVGNEIQVGAGFDFLNEPDASQYAIRVSGLGDVSGETGQQTFTLTLVADSDADDLPDFWELVFAPNLGVLDGKNGADADADNLSDLAEFTANPDALPAGLDPTNPDTDSDTLKDGAEIAGAGTRGPTNPTDADSDDDSLTDGQESNSGLFVDASDTGSDPNAPDTDADGYRDGFEVLRGGDPVKPGVTPMISPSVSFAVLTDDASSGISGTKTYTHALSGGGAATVNGVPLQNFSPTTTPPNFAWSTGAFTMTQVAAINNGDWLPAMGGVTGPGLLDLLGGFTYSGTGANSGASQTFTLSGLTPGQGYRLRLFIRLWDTEGSGRAADLSFTNGAQTDYAPLLEDRPAIVLGVPGAVHAAYAVEYSYVAAGTELVITSAVPPGSQVPNGSLHLYGLTNEIGGPPKLPVITAVSYDASVPKFSITFDSQPGVTYALDFSTTLASGLSLGDWSELSDSIASEGNTTTWDDSQLPNAGLKNAFYRLRILE
jgi:hypothetical protein